MSRSSRTERDNKAIVFLSKYYPVTDKHKESYSQKEMLFYDVPEFPASLADKLSILQHIWHTYTPKQGWLKCVIFSPGV